MFIKQVKQYLLNPRKAHPQLFYKLLFFNVSLYILSFVMELPKQEIN